MQARQDVEKGKTVVKAPTIVDQTSRLPFRQLMIVFAALQLVLFMSVVDQTSVSTIIPVLGDSLGASQSISWVGSSYLVATTSFQIIYGRMSDIFGRKQAILCAIALFGIGNLLSGFAQSAIWLFITRSITGVGGGGIFSLSMIIVSDIVSLRDRGKYQGIIGCAVAIGNGIGPLVGGALAEHASWRWVFWFTVPVALVSATQIAFTLPLTKVTGNHMEKLRKIDWFGCFLSLASIILILVPISGGGNTYPWKSALVIVMLTIGGSLFIVFIIYEWKVATLPILPLHLFKNRVVTVIFFQTFLSGIIFYGNLYYLPLYYQNVLGMNATLSGIFMIPLVVPQTIASVTCGQITTRTGRMVPQIAVGFFLWTICTGLQSMFNAHTSHAKIIGILVVEGIGVGCTIQTTLVAAQCAADKADRAVITGTRNFFRTMGGAVGLTIAGAVLDNLLDAKLDSMPDVNPALKANIGTNGLTKLGGQVSPELLSQLRMAYSGAIYFVFVMFIPVTGLAFVSSFCMKDVRTTGDEVVKKPSQNQSDAEADTREGSVSERK